MNNFLMIMEKAVCTLGLVTLQDKKIRSNNYQFLCVRRLINILALFLLWHLNWIERYSTMKIGRFLFVWVYIVGWTFGNHVLRLRSRVAVKLNFRTYIRRYTSPNENFEYSYPLSGMLLWRKSIFAISLIVACIKVRHTFASSDKVRSKSLCVCGGWGGGTPWYFRIYEYPNVGSEHFFGGSKFWISIFWGFSEKMGVWWWKWGYNGVSLVGRWWPAFSATWILSPLTKKQQKKRLSWTP